MGTKHFSDDQLCTSGIHPDIENNCPDEFEPNIQHLAEVLEEERRVISDYFSEETPIFVRYGYRGPLLNMAVGGSGTSAHLEGLAADTFYQGHDAELISSILMRHPDFMNQIDQLIVERGCLHVGLPCKASKYQARHELRHESFENGRRIYLLTSIWRPK